MTGAALIKLLGGVRATVFAAIALLLLVVCGVQTWRVDYYREQRDLWVAASDACHGANIANAQTIADLRDANEKWAGVARETEKQAARAVETVAAERDALAAELEESRRQRRGTYEKDPSAAAWGRARVPRAIADGLRQ